MVFHVCKADGAIVGQFDEEDFRNKVLRGELEPSGFYWCKGMTGWKSISAYQPPGKVTTILRNIPTREMKRAALSTKPGNTPLKKLKRLFGADKIKK